MSAELIQALQNAAVYDHPVTEFKVLETHISWVILTGPYAYKIKKPIKNNFLDYSTLEKRQHYCSEEMRLNQRLTEDVYQAVVPIVGSETAPLVNQPGQALEYAVKMRQFPQENRLDAVLTAGKLSPEMVDQLADAIAAFHEKIPTMTHNAWPATVPVGASPEVANKPLGSPELTHYRVTQNFDITRPLVTDPKDLEKLDALRSWAETTYLSLIPIFVERKKNGFFRECHGDLHLGNIALINGKPCLFDCVEFYDLFRWCDIISEIAYIFIDLIYRGATHYAYRLLNRYLEHTGDYAGLALLPYFCAYRCMVRAKVSMLQKIQYPLDDTEKHATLLAQYHNYIALAEQLQEPHKLWLLITQGVAGSGKTTLSEQVLEHLHTIRIRSDVERKRLAGIKPFEHSDRSIYTASLSQKTYQRLAELATIIIQAGYPAIVEATFLKAEHRQKMQLLADTLHVPFAILECHASETTLERWITKRLMDDKDASEATVDVMRQQLKANEPITPAEKPYAVLVDSEKCKDVNEYLEPLKRLLV